jgi:Tfp pilus assembly protein FimT
LAYWRLITFAIVGKRHTGLTLVELMVTLAVAIVLLGVGIPAFLSLQANSRAAALANQVVTALTLARMEALGRGASTAVCPRGEDDSDGTPTCGGAADWVRRGWMVFVDSGPTAGVLDTAADGEGAVAIVRIFDPPPGQPTITLQERTTELKNNGATTKTEAITSVRFLASGWRMLPTGVYAEAAFTLSTTGATSGHARCVLVNQSGRVQVAPLAAGGSCL